MTRKRTCAVIVTFEPKVEGLLKTLAALADQVEGIVIVDNGSTHLEAERLPEMRRSLVVKKLATNKGIGAAQNEGMAMARLLGYDYILLLDQDSVPQNGMVGSLRGTLERLREKGYKVACVGPRVCLPESGNLSNFSTLGWLSRRYSVCGDSSTSIECDMLNSSGSLVPLEVIEEIGGMEEDFFIDRVDMEWCLRARARGYRIFGACGAVLEHHLGESTQRVWAGRWRMLPRHKPFRYYYIFRNTILLSRRNYAPLKWVLFNARWLAALFLLYGVFARDRRGELGMMVKGMLHGIRGITGKLGT